jgi:hypothetical protein
VRGGFGWTLKSVSHHGVDVTDRGIELAPEQAVEDVEIAD